MGPSEARPLNILSVFYCALLCLNGVLKQSLFNKCSKSRGGQNTLHPPTSKSRGDMSPCPPHDRRPWLWVSLGRIDAGPCVASMDGADDSAGSSVHMDRRRA